MFQSSSGEGIVTKKKETNSRCKLVLSSLPAIFFFSCKKKIGQIPGKIPILPHLFFLNK